MPYPLEINGLYTWKGKAYQVIQLGTAEDTWSTLGLMGDPFEGMGSQINYVRPDGAIIDVMFAVVGHASELELLPPEAEEAHAQA